MFSSLKAHSLGLPDLTSFKMSRNILSLCLWTFSSWIVTYGSRCNTLELKKKGDEYTCSINGLSDSRTTGGSC